MKIINSLFQLEIVYPLPHLMTADWWQNFRKQWLVLFKRSSEAFSEKWEKQTQLRKKKKEEAFFTFSSFLPISCNSLTFWEIRFSVYGWILLEDEYHFNACVLSFTAGASKDWNRRLRESRKYEESVQEIVWHITICKTWNPFSHFSLCLLLIDPWKCCCGWEAKLTCIKTTW